MLKKLPGQIKASLAILILVFSTSLFFIPLLFIGLLKLFPNQRWQAFCTAIVDQLVMCWLDINNGYINLSLNINWQIAGLENLSLKQWYLVVANHQSWADIVILQHLFNRKIPVLKFFIKDQLKWVPLLGFAWWAMGCPYMKRYSKDYLLKNPHKKGKDLIAAKKALELFNQKPAAVMNFIEGTRFTQKKKISQESPYQFLLKPKAGGLSLVISAMSEKINNILEVTIIYNKPHNSLWNFLCNRVDTITVLIRQIAIPPEFCTSALAMDDNLQSQFRSWLNNQWQEKDKLMAQSINDNN